MIPKETKKKSAIRRAVVAVFGGFFVLHFLLITIYCLTDIKLPGAIRNTTYRYVVPLFHQGYSLFAPDLQKYTIDTEFRGYNDHWTSWTLADETSPASDHSKMRYMIERYALMLAGDMERNFYYKDSTLQYDAVQSGKAFYAINYYCFNGYKSTNNLVPDSMQIRVTIKHSPDFHSDVKPDDQVFTFPSTATNDK